TTGGRVVPVRAPTYLSWLTSKEFPTTPPSYPIVAVVDDGIDDGSNNPRHPDFHELGLLGNPSRLVFNQNCTFDTVSDSTRGDGNVNAWIVAAYNNLTGSPHQDASGFHRDLGISPYGRIGGVKVFDNLGFGEFACAPTYAELVEPIYHAGAAITSNSWGSGFE